VKARLLLSCLLLGACSPALKVHSEPSGAILTFPSGERVVTPSTLDSSVWPERRRPVIISAAGYRTLEARVPYRSQGEWLIVLVPVHGPVGTWNEEDVP
jgi:hypothetical protein